MNPWLCVLSIITFTIYTLVWDVGLIVGCAYLVFWREASPWWFVPALYFVTASYKPKHWRQLWIKEEEEEEE